MTAPLHVNGFIRCGGRLQRRRRGREQQHHDAQRQAGAERLYAAPAQGVKAIIGSLQNAQVTGEEKVGGAQTWHVEGTVQSDVLATAVPISRPGLTVGIEVWIEVDGSLIRQVYLKGPIAPGEAENIVRKLALSDFGEQITITPPSQ